MRDVAAQVGTDLNRTVTPKQAQAAVQNLQTCRGLLTTTRKKTIYAGCADSLLGHSKINH